MGLFTNIFSKLGMAGICVAFLSSTAVAGDHRSYGSMKDDYVAPLSYGYYFEGRIGGVLDDSFDSDMVSPNVAGANGALEIGIDDGIGFELAIGKVFSPSWRADIALAFGTADDLTIDYTGAPANPLSAGVQPVASNGDVRTISLMANVYRTFDMQLGRIKPFVGVGIGFTNIDLDNVAPTGSRFVVDDDDTVFTFAHHLGFDMPLNEKVDFTLRYTGIISTGGDFSARDTTNAGGLLTVSTDSDYVPAVSAGVRIKLN